MLNQLCPIESHYNFFLPKNLKQTYYQIVFLQNIKAMVWSSRSSGFVVTAVVCEARGPGFNSKADQMFFLSPGV